MLRILDRYLFREIATTWLAVTLILLMILLTNQFARVLGEVAKGKLPKGAAMDVIGLSAVQYLTVLVPIGLFLSIMLALVGYALGNYLGVAAAYLCNMVT